MGRSAATLPPLFVLAGKSVVNGGAMAEEEEAGGVVEGNKPVVVGMAGSSAGSGAGPENGLPVGTGKVGTGKTMDLLRKKAEEALVENFVQIVKCIVRNIEANHLPSVKLLCDLAERVEDKQNIPMEDYQSLAEVLWKGLKEQDEVGK
ncbi:hypothetical protein [Acidicapsa ligni]|uniref:hypothetical protein n=1 Tax=Acidicapsa ligni TaxID=542300 RepID=UPI0021DF89C1|nr:hypothetical protein [Acidicapsa ligni]